LRAAERERERELGQLEWAAREKGRGKREFLSFSFFKKIFSNSFFKLSNFNQIRNHAFES
jgi:hypothetical protein